MEEEGLTEAAAAQETQKELSQLLPEGQATHGNAFHTVCRADGISVGWIWTVIEEQTDGRECFLCDYLIFEAERRHGYGLRGLQQMESLARKNGCDRCVLFVRDSNPGAAQLYRKAGYVPLAQHSYGMYMTKSLL